MSLLLKNERLFVNLKCFILELFIAKNYISAFPMVLVSLWIFDGQFSVIGCCVAK